VDTPFIYHSRTYLLIDTAGIRRASKIARSYERYSVIRALKALDRTQVALIVLDATAGVTAQDCKIASLAEEKGCSCLLLVNKWDLIASQTLTQKDFSLDIREELKYLDYAPILFVSALTGRGAERIFPEIERTAQEREKRVATSLLNRVLQQAIEAHQPPTAHGQSVGIYYATQLDGAPPTFLIFANKPEAIAASYRRYLIHKLREAFGFRGTPIRLAFRKRE
jgi:GTP-binding protein